MDSTTVVLVLVVAMSGVLGLVSAFLTVDVALTVTNAVVHIQNKDGHRVRTWSRAAAARC